MMQHSRYLIVGGGLTADGACKGIREVDPDGTILLVGEEPHAPYARPPLSKGLSHTTLPSRTIRTVPLTAWGSSPTSNSGPTEHGLSLECAR